MLLAKFIMRLLKKKLYGYSDVVIAFSDVRSRESSCSSPPSPSHRHGKSRMPRVVTITDGAKSVGDNITHQFTHPLAPSRSPFNSHRNAASPKPVAVLHLRLRYRKSGMPRDVTITDEPNLSAATSRIYTSAGAVTIAVQLHRNATSLKRYKGNRANSPQRECFFQIREHPMLPQQQPVSVTPHRMSCPCLVSFSVGHYDVLVSTPDSMFIVV